jgi:hypothetical protein
MATLTDLSLPGEGTRAMAEALAHPLDESERAARHASVRARFGWDSLREQYVQLLLRVAELPR